MSEISLEVQPPLDAGHKVSVAARSSFNDGDPDAGQVERLFDQVQRRNAQLEQRDRQLTALYEIDQTLAATLDVRQLYRVIFREIAQKLLGAPHLLIALFDPETETLSCGFVICD